MKQILEEREDMVFYIKLLPLEIHPASYQKAKSIVCERSLRLLERAFDGWNIPDPACETTAVDETMALAKELGITGTPAMVLPDGAVVRGFKDAATLAKLIETAGIAAEAAARAAEAAEADVPSYGEEAPGYGEEAPAYGEESPGYGEEAPAYGEESPGYGEETPGYGEEEPPAERKTTPFYNERNTPGLSE
jgi:hypothetical protein